MCIDVYKKLGHIPNQKKKNQFVSRFFFLPFPQLKMVDWTKMIVVNVWVHTKTEDCGIL